MTIRLIQIGKIIIIAIFDRIDIQRRRIETRMRAPLDTARAMMKVITARAT
jgi:hypothetical protein